MNILLDGRRMESPAEAHNYLKEALNFPDYYGENLDALWDMLTSLDHPTFIVLNFSGKMRENLGVYGRKMLLTFKEAARQNHHLHFREKKWRYF